MNEKNEGELKKELPWYKYWLTIQLHVLVHTYLQLLPMRCDTQTTHLRSTQSRN